MLTLIKTPDDMLISMKTGFGKYVGVDSEGNLVATADAVGTRERMIVVFQEVSFHSLRLPLIGEKAFLKRMEELNSAL